MKKIFWLICLVAGVQVFAQKNDFNKSFKITVNNPASFERQDVMVHIPQNKLTKDFNPKGFVVTDGQADIPVQYNTHDKDYPGIVFLLDKMGVNEEKIVTVRYIKKGEVKIDYPKRVQAELSHQFGGAWKGREYFDGKFKNVEYLRVPPEHKDHSWFIRYEGPGWESDKVGYRFYLDQRNAVDVFGKKVTEPILQLVGQDGFDSYHEMQDWGMDVLKVAKSLGVGSIGYFDGKLAQRVEFTDSVDSRIIENGVVYASILTNYYGWKVGEYKTDLTSRLTIHAGSRLTQNLLRMSEDLDHLCSGLIKDKNGKVFKQHGNPQSYGYLASYGKQSLNNDNLGIAVLFSASDFIDFTEDQFSHIVKMKPVNKQLTYYFLAAWAGEPGGIKTEEEFLKYLDQVAKELAQPIQIK